ncbi:MAG TPA: hypothetical protein VE954_25440 [Oligoflexus sp.]|uniref:hypothetical protein n=1 Tax=Oligoflexus sp. TaxID=1971216 RepID=UPI002D30B4AE|nr:hypothetical protein [Oligoflexus sp.]HYX36465.1 hypothetical protein [Oligoflexus sp.]
MNRTFIPLVTLSTSIVLGLACGSVEQQNLRKVAQGALDAVPAKLVDFSFSLPSRSNLGLDTSVLQQKMTGYAWRVEGQGDHCTDTKVHESFGPYEDARTYAMQLSDNCNYLVKIMVGELAPQTALNLTATINYDEHIKPVIQKECVSCHAEYTDFSEIEKDASSIVAHIENETMPPNAPLDGATIALFLAWSDDGFKQSNPNPTPITPADTALSSVFYRNNTNDFIMSYELMGRTTYELRRSLWIQPAGDALGLENQQIYTFRVTTPATTPTAGLQ